MNAALLGSAAFWHLGGNEHASENDCWRCDTNKITTRFLFSAITKFWQGEMKKNGIKIGSNFKLINGKIVFDQKAADAKLDLCTRLKKRGSKRVRVMKSAPR